MKARKGLFTCPDEECSGADPGFVERGGGRTASAAGPPLLGGSASSLIMEKRGGAPRAPQARSLARGVR